MKYILLKAIILALMFQLIQLTVTAQIPDGYYSSAQGKTGDELKSALNEIISDHIEFPYTSSSTDVWDILKETDRDPINPDNVILIYTGWSVNGEQEYNNGDGWSREHVWAKSRGDFGNFEGPGTDVHALRPCDITVNSDRGNRWFANCEEPHLYEGQPTGNYFSTSDWVWEPREEVKGDVARMIFYMATRYEGKNGELDLEVIDYLPANNFTNEPVHAKLSDLVKWHNEDPVDDWERNRNNIIYESYQKNRNPFIDHPEFVDKIFGPTASSSETNLVNNNQKELLKIVDQLGREVEFQSNIPLIYIYSDGSSERKVVME